MSSRIVFDLDGTLIDSLPEIHAATAILLEEEGIAPLDRAVIESFVGNGLPHLVKLVIDATSLDMSNHAALCDRLLGHYNALSGTLTRPYPGVGKALSTLAEQGHRLGVCTNKPEAPARDILHKLDLGVFEHIIGGDSLPQRKPDPAPLLHVFDAMGDGPMLFVGDSEVDAETAQRAQVPFALYTRGYLKGSVSDVPHDALFDDFSALPSLVARMMSDAA